MRRWLWRLGLVVALAGGGLLLWYALLRKDPVPVTVFIVARGRVEETVTNSKAGTVKSRHRASLSAELGGRVDEVRVRKGDRVLAGGVLLRLDDTQYLAQLANAERALAAARGEEKRTCLETTLAEKDFVRAEDLARDRIISQEMLDQARNRLDVSRAACDAAGARSGQLAAQLQVARAELSKTVLRAPFDGVVAELKVERGEWVTPSPPGIPMPAVLDLIDPDSIYVSAPLDEVDRGKVSLGLPVRITMDAYPGKPFPGGVTRIAPYITDVAEQSRTFEVEATFDDAAFARTLPAGASADVEVILRARDGVLRIPTYALLEGKRVLVLESCTGGSRPASLATRLLASGGDCLVSKDVRAGLKNWEFVEITGGLGEREKVVVSLDRAEVKEGATARQAAVTEK